MPPLARLGSSSASPTAETCHFALNPDLSALSEIRIKPADGLRGGRLQP